MRARLFFFPVVFLCLLLQIGCFGSVKKEERPGFETVPPHKLQALGLPLSAFVVVSLDPDTRHPLLLDSSTNSFKGEVEVPLGSQFDLTVIYTADDPVSGKRVEIAHYVRKAVLAETETTQVVYMGDENNWQTLFDLSPGTPNDLNLDGDAYNNFIEVAYGSHPENSESLPEGAKTSATHKDPIFGSQDVALPPPGADITAALKGEEEILLEATTPFDLKEFKLLSPSYGIELLSSTEEILKTKKMRVRINTKRFVTGNKVGQMVLVIRVVDEYDLARETTLTFSVYNPSDDLPPLRLQLGLTNNQVIRDSVNFPWELDDPSGIDSSNISVLLRSLDRNFTVGIPVTDEKPDASRLLSQISLETTGYSDGTYQIEFLANDLSGNTLFETVPVRIQNSRAVSQFGAKISPVSSPVAENDGLTLSARESVGPFPNQLKRYEWRCTDLANFNPSGMGEVFRLDRLPNVTRAEGTKTIRCRLLFENGSFREEATTSFDVRFVNAVPVIDTLQLTPTNGSDILPNNFTISWNSVDPDGDSLLYDLTIRRQSPTGSSVTMMTCSNLTISSLNETSDLSNLCTEPAKGFGEMLSPFRLGAKTTYSFLLTAKDLDGATGQTTTSGDVSDSNLLGRWSSNALEGIGLPFEAPDEETFDFGTNDFTLSAWISPEGDGGRETILSKSNGTNGFNLYRNSFNYIHLEILECSTFLTSRKPTSNWMQVVVTRKGSIFSMYLNGELEDQDAGSRPVQECRDITINNDSALMIGCNRSSGSCTDSFGTSIDEVSVYNRALSVDEIRRDCRRNHPNPTSCPDPKKPIILSPTPNQLLPPTRIFWSWRGEKDPDGRSPVYPDQRYKVDFDIDTNLTNGAFEPTFVPSYNNISDQTSESSESHVESEWVDPDQGYKVRVRPVQDGSVLSGFDSTRVFLTDDSVVAWWNFYEGTGSIAGDVVGDRDGQLINFAGVGWNDGLLDLDAPFTDRSLNFDGNDDFVDISHHSDLVPANLTLEVWVRPSGLNGCSGDNCGILNKSSGGNGYRLGISPSGEVSFSFGDGVTGETNSASATLINGLDSWTHFATTHNGSEGSLFQNGGLESSATAPLRDSLGNPNLQIGRDYPTGYFNGIIDEVRLYNRAMDSVDLCNSYLAFCLGGDAGDSCDMSCIPD